MSWTVVGRTNWNAASTGGFTDIGLSTDLAYAIGDVVLILIAIDNRGSTDGDNNELDSCADNSTQAGAANVYNKIEFQNSQGGAGLGITCGLWYCRLTRSLLNTDAIAPHLADSTTRNYAVALIKVTVGDTVSLQGSNTLANDGTAVGSLDVTTPSATFLRIRLIASETGDTTALTGTAGWTVGAADSQSVGAGDTGVSLRYEYHISAGTGDASAPTYVSADHASIYAAFLEGSLPGVEDPYLGLRSVIGAPMFGGVG